MVQICTGPSMSQSKRKSGPLAACDLRVALFSGNYNYVKDGANQALNSLVGYLMSQGVNVRVYSPTTARPAFEPVGSLVSVPSIPIIANGRSEYRIALGMPKSIRKDVEAFCPNVVHVSAPDLLGHRALSYAAKRGIFSAVSLHTRFETYLDYYRLGSLRALLENIQRRFYNRADSVLIPVPSIGQVLQGWGVKTPLSMWSRGVDSVVFSRKRRDDAWRRSLGIKSDDVVVGFLGRLVLEKGLATFAEIHRHLIAKGVKHKLLIVGDGPAREWFQSELPEAVFVGHQTGPNLGRAVASMDIFCNPSETEAFGNVNVEAMACALPIVAANATGAIDHVKDGENGFLVPAKSVCDFAHALEKLILDAKLRACMGAKSEQLARKYDWDRCNQSVLDHYLASAADCNRLPYRAN